VSGSTFSEEKAGSNPPAAAPIDEAILGLFLEVASPGFGISLAERANG
jgi:hypothetical protein